ncbi:2-hydroxyacid dehydrogenase [Paenibacillus cymbidii]|uniref:2-hydroxyacid dehydrogenase n=1 Tax=Paenibacillus cymbidii TaxID=1639034 RepID=UPI0010803F7C|nr:D-glycerate dehydrogenase [Paenibacillus cymbidii]
MKPAVFVARPIPAAVEAFLREHCEVRKWDSYEPIGRDRYFAELAAVEGLITSGGLVNRELLSHAPKLKIVSNISVGYNNLDIEALRERGIVATHTPGALDETVADLVFSLILATARRVPEMDKLVRAGEWRKGDDRVLFGVDVHHKKLGIIGMGRIGEAIARRAKLGFRMDVAYHNRSRKPEVEAAYGAEYRTLPELLAESDFIVLMTPLTKDTERLIGREQFAAMKRSAIFINASRGQTVDEQAMIAALQDGTIRGAGLDVFEQEPVSPDNPLLQLPNVVVLPHLGSATTETRDAMAMLAARNLIDGLEGRTPPNVIPELRA